MSVYALPFVGLALCVFAFALIAYAARLVRHDVREARRLGRILIGLSALAVPAAWVVLPGRFDPTFGPATSVLQRVPDELSVLIAASTAYLVGLAWMTRIYRTSHLEPDASSWRYRG